MEDEDLNMSRFDDQDDNSWDLDEDGHSRFVLSGDVNLIRNDALVCARCAHMWEHSTAECEVFEQKPLSVLRGGECADFTPLNKE